MNEFERLQELYRYKILDTAPEKDLDELAELASTICEVPVSLISLLDEKRQWFKAAIGLDISQTSRADSFCQHTLHSPKKVLVVNDATKDERFKDSHLVAGSPNIRFYAGAPLETPDGHVLGTLCIIDTKPREFSEKHQKALQIIAKKVMKYLNIRRLLLEKQEYIEFSNDRFLKLTDQAPGAIFQLEMKPDGTMYFPFISKGFTDIHPELSLEELKTNAAIAFSVVHPDDLESVKNSLKASFLNHTNWNVEYRIIPHSDKTIWHWANAKAEKMADGTVVWYGTFQDITNRKEYQQTLEQILFDISHVMRRPVANMLGLTAAIKNYNFNEVKLKECLSHLEGISTEMDSYIRKLNIDYTQLRTSFSERAT